MDSLERQQALAEFLREDYRRLFAFVLSLVHNPHDTQDVIQETCKTLLEKFDEYDRDKPFCSWAFGIARNKALQHLERSHRRHEQFNTEVVTRLADLWEERAAKREGGAVDALRACLQKLEQRQHRLVLACYGGAHTVREVAEGLGRSPSSVHNSLARIRSALLKCVRRIIDAEVVQ